MSDDILFGLLLHGINFDIQIQTLSSSVAIFSKYYTPLNTPYNATLSVTEI